MRKQRISNQNHYTFYRQPTDLFVMVKSCQRYIRRSGGLNPHISASLPASPKKGRDLTQSELYGTMEENEASLPLNEEELLPFADVHVEAP